MFRKFFISALVAGATLGMALTASPAQADAINSQSQNQASNSGNTVTNNNPSDIQNNNENRLDSAGISLAGSSADATGLAFAEGGINIAGLVLDEEIGNGIENGIENGNDNGIDPPEI